MSTSIGVESMPNRQKLAHAYGADEIVDFTKEDVIDRVMNRVDPTLMTTHTFGFDEMERAFEVADKKLDDVVKVLVRF